jgi:Domain of unknown function (DUF4157)
MAQRSPTITAEEPVQHRISQPATAPPAKTGSPLPPADRTFFESAFGTDLSMVRIHADQEAAGSARLAGANAYTIGPDIFFATGRYAPATQAGRHILAHELSHVIQQRSSQPTSARAGDARAEADADQAGRTAESGRPAVVTTATGVGIARQDAEATTSQGAALSPQETTSERQRLPSPSAASAVPALVKGMQKQFHAEMSEAAQIIRGIRFHYKFVNGIYAGAFGHAQAAAAAAKKEELKNEQIVDGIIGAASLVLSFTPEGEAANLAIKIAKSLEKVEAWHSRIEGAGKVLSALGLSHEEEEKELDPEASTQQKIVGLEKVIELQNAVADAHNLSDRVFDEWVDVSTNIAENTPDSGALSSDQAAALQAAQSACQDVLAWNSDLMDSLRELQKRRQVRIPSWAETEQDIWIAFFASTGKIGTEESFREHMVSIGMWGPPGQPGGRLGVAESEEIGQLFRDPKVVPGHEDERKQQSVGASPMDWMSIIRRENAQLPAKWKRIMLLVG